MALIEGDNDPNTLNDNPLENDTINAFDGNDTINVTGGIDTVDGGAGDDTLNLALANASVSANLGSEYDFVNLTSPGVSQIRLMFTSSEVGNGNALDGNNNVNEDGGLAVRLQAEDGSDALTGPISRFDDEGITFIAAAGTTFDVRDLPTGVGRGDQFGVAVLGSQGGDFFTAVQADSAYYFNAGLGNDTVTGGTATDFLVGGGGNDSLTAGLGNDSFIGGGGNDTIRGGDGNNTVAAFNVTTDGADNVNLGQGSDIFNVSAAEATNVRIQFTSSEVGNGSAVDGNNNPNEDVGLAVRLQAEDGTGAPTGPVTRVDDEGITFIGGAGVTFDVRDLPTGVGRGEAFEIVALGSMAAETMTAVQSDRAYYFNAGMGADTVTGGTAADFLVGGAGDDSLDGGTGGDRFIGGGGNDTIAGSDADDIVAAFNISLDGADSVNLGAGSDIFNISASAPTNVRLMFTSAEAGNGNANDAGTLANQDGGLAVRLQAEDGADGLTGAVTRADDEGITFIAGAGVTFDIRDLVSGVARGDQFEVAVLGTQAGDTLTAVQADRAYYFNAGGGNDTVSGGNAADFLVGGGGNDSLSGGSGTDSFLGGGGNDILTGGLGLDTLTGGLGNDTYINPGDGDTIVELAGEGIDTVISSDTSISIEAFTAIERLFFTGNNTLNGTGNLIANQINGNDGANVLSGRDGDDTVNGGGGADTLNGGGGADTLNGGLQRDKIITGADNSVDTVVYSMIGESTGFRRDVITGFDADGEDRIDLPTVPSAFANAIGMGTLNAATFNMDLAAILDPAALPAGNAVLFTPTSGDLAQPGMVYLIVDANGTAGYQANEDWVFQLENHTGTLDTSDFI